MDLYGTAGIRGPVETRVTPSLALEVGQAMAAGVRNEEGDTREVVVGRDGRVSGPALAAAVEAGLSSGGVTVRHVGQIPTPALAFASQGRRGVMLTASHNPPADNGIKTFVDGIEYSREQEREVERLVEDQPGPAEWETWGTSASESVLTEYLNAVAAYARSFGAEAEGLRIVVDCGNGMGALGTPAVLDKLEGEITTLNGNVDGHFTGRDSKPTADALLDCRRFMRYSQEAGDFASSGFDLGIAHDGDADRIVVLDGRGEIVHEDTVVAIIAEKYVSAAAEDRTVEDPVVVTTPNASARIDDRVDAAGGRVERVALGYLHDGIRTIEERGGDVVFAAEPWKHIHPAFGGWIDGICSAAVLTRLVAADPDGLAGLREPVEERPYRKANVECPEESKKAAISRVETDLRETFSEGEIDTQHGVRVDLPDGSWILVRPSGTEPYIRLYAESDDVDDLLEAAVELVSRAVESEGP